MKTIQYPYPIATQISISKDRRIRLPKFLGISVPYVLLENKRAEQPWLGLCNVDSLALLRAECESLQLVAEFRTCRPTIPRPVCDRHSLSDQTNIWLVTIKSWIEVWPDSAWQNQISLSCVLDN